MVNYRTILIVTYGRSGSTLLQGILNAIPNVTIRGENNNFCWGLYEAWKAILQTREEFEKYKRTKQSDSVCYGAAYMDPKRFEELALEVIKSQLDLSKYADDLTWGFKEVRYIDYLDELPRFLNFMARVLPNLGIIFNTREHASVVRNWHCPEKNVKNLPNLLSKADRVFFEYAEKNKNAFICRYERVILGKRGLSPLFDFLGTQPRIEDLIEVLENSHDYSGENETVERSKVLRTEGENKFFHRPSLPPYLDKVSEKMINSGNCPVVISTIKNEIERLPWFLEYYRKLGVKSFIFVDNESKDQSSNFLKDQPDVTLYHAPENFFSKSKFGTEWTDALSYEHALGRWVLVADVDEVLTWPGCQGQGLGGLVKEADRLGLNRVFTPMIDVYGSVPCSEMEPYQPGEPFSKWANLIDPFEKMKHGFRNGRFFLFGGPRMRFSKPSVRPPIMSKQKLYFVEDGGFKSSDPHFDNYVLPSPLVVPFLHYKFLPDFEEKIDRAILEGQHWNNAEEYKSYKGASLYQRNLTIDESIQIQEPEDLQTFIDKISKQIRGKNISGSIHWKNKTI